MQIKANDTVEVITGEDRGTSGKVLRVDRKTGKVVVEGVNRVYKHVQPQPEEPAGRPAVDGDADRCRNVLLVCESCGAATRVGVRYLDDGAKERYCKKCGAGNGQIVSAQGPIRQEITRIEHERSQSKEDGGEKPQKQEAGGRSKEPEAAPTPRLLQKYESEILPALAEQLGRTNRLSLPRLKKIVVNMGVGTAIGEKKHLEEAVDAMRQITGQKPLVTLAASRSPASSSARAWRSAAR